MADNVASALCYALGLITGVLFLVLAPYNQNKTIRFHAFQSIFFNIAAIVISMVLGIVLRMVLGWFTAASLMTLVHLAFFVAWVFLLISAYQGKTIVIPVIGPIAQQQA